MCSVLVIRLSSLRLLRVRGIVMFPYTTLFRSLGANKHGRSRGPAALKAKWGGATRLCFSLEAGRCTKRSEEYTSELQSHVNIVCRLLLEKKNKKFKIAEGQWYRYAPSYVSPAY